MEWWTAVLAFVGACVGSGVCYIAARRDVTQRETAAPRDLSQREEQANLEEWGRRFTAALQGVSSQSTRERSLSRVLLVQLGSSALATQEERDLVRAVLDAGARFDDEGEDVTVPRPGAVVDEIVYVEDTDDDDDGGAS